MAVSTSPEDRVGNNEVRPFGNNEETPQRAVSKKSIFTTERAESPSGTSPHSCYSGYGTRTLSTMMAGSPKSLPKKKVVRPEIKMAKAGWDCGFVCRAKENRGIEVRHIDLQWVTKQVFGAETSWQALELHEQAGLLRLGLSVQHHFILDPQAPYCKIWDMVLLLALLYVAIATPWEVSFLITQPATLTGPRFVVNTMVDCIFFKDMIMQFFLIVKERDKEGRWRWIRSRRRICVKYLRGWFVLDLVSIIPFEALGAIFKDAALQRFKVVRAIRFLRLLKLARVLRATRLVDRWKGHLLAVRHSTVALTFFVCLIVFLSHWMACMWGLVGNFFGDSNLECDAGKPSVIVDTVENPDGRSWITDRGDLWSPDSACNPWHVYIQSLHYAIMTVTSIGYGNIVPTRSEEYFFGVACQLGGGITWAYVIGACCGIIASTNSQRVYFERAMDALNVMLETNRVDYDVRLRAREFLREARHHQFLMRTRELTSLFSRELRGDLTAELAIGNGIGQVWYLRSADSTMVLRIAQEFESTMLAAKEVADDLVGHLCVLERGAVARAGRILVPVSVWGEDVIVSNAALQVPDPVLTLTYADVLALCREKLFPIVEEYPAEASRLRIAAAHIALKRWAHLICRSIKLGTNPNLILHPDHEKGPSPFSWPDEFGNVHSFANATSVGSGEHTPPTRPSGGERTPPRRSELSDKSERVRSSEHEDALVLQELQHTRHVIAESFNDSTRMLRHMEGTAVVPGTFSSKLLNTDHAQQKSPFVTDIDIQEPTTAPPILRDFNDYRREAPRGGRTPGAANGIALGAPVGLSASDVAKLSRQLAALSGHLALLQPQRRVGEPLAAG